MTKTLQKKLNKLQRILRKYPGVVVAFSGGVDSTFLLKAAMKALQNRVIAVTAVSPLYPLTETIIAKKIARLLRVKHIIISSREMEDRRFVGNPQNRCYFCKIELFGRLKNIARQYGYSVVEGSNASDLSDFRPGLEAAHKLDILSPLINAALTKSEIRCLARRFGLPNWNKPSMACLASRIPYGRPIDRVTIKRIGKAEKFLNKLKLTQLRVRDHFPIARIEVLAKESAFIFKNQSKIVRYFKLLGYRYVTLDLEGYRTGSMNL